MEPKYIGTLIARLIIKGKFAAAKKVRGCGKMWTSREAEAIVAACMQAAQMYGAVTIVDQFLVR